MAGVSFDHLERLATRGTSQCARELLLRRIELEVSRAEAERLLGSRASGFSAETSRAYRTALRTGGAAEGVPGPHPAEITRHTSAAIDVAVLETELRQTLEQELESARVALSELSRAVLPAYLVFGAGEFRERLGKTSDGSCALPARNSRTRERERHLLLYLQRVCAKNDTFSAFGPSGWGTVDSRPCGVSRPVGDGTETRRIFLERWAAHALAMALNHDVEARPEVSPRMNPNGRVEGDTFVLADSGERVPLTGNELEVLARCDGKSPAHSLGASDDLLARLADRQVIRWECEVPALEPHAFEVLLADIAQWRESEVRTRWLEKARSIAGLPKQFGLTNDPESRAGIMANARRLLDELGTRQSGPQRFLYAASNPIVEECAHECGFTISSTMTDELARDAAPWFGLWRDTYAFVASRVAVSLHNLFLTAPMRNGAVALPAFLQHCAASNLPLTGHGIVALAHLAFQEVKGAFREMLSARADASEWELTASDCAFVRRQFPYERFDEYTYPSADLQLSASSFAAIERGDYRWIVSELHPPVALLHHALYWSCPDKPALSRALSCAADHRPAVHYGLFAADFTAHTTVRFMDALPELMTFVAPQRSNPRWRTLPPAEVEVFVDETNDDVGLRKRGSREYLGSFARAWVIPLGFHPFHFGHAPHMPRLRCGKVIVQRQSWTVTIEELPPGDYTGISPNLVLAIEQLRAAKDWPRHIFIRPTEQALRRSGAEGRDKDTKPVFIDLESYLSLEIFHRWLVKAGELEVTEMLPDPDHLCWHEADGRRTFELRTLIVPRSPKQ